MSKIDKIKFILQVFQTPEPLSSHLQPPATGQAELPQAAGQAPLQPTPVNTQPSAQAASATPGVPTATAVPTQVSLTLLTICWTFAVILRLHVCPLSV